MNIKRRSDNTLQAVAMVGSYLPRRCGIGTFTSDLAESLAAAEPDLAAWAVAMNDRPEGYRYPPRVWFEIGQNRLGEYRLAADFLNLSNVDICCVQHEFGLFGGRAGLYLLEMLRRLRMPVVSTLHTVLKDPDADQRHAVEQLAQVSDRLVVMAERAVTFLTDIYGIDPAKIALIHHGIPDVPFMDPNFFKDQFDVEGRKVVLTFGLLSPNKGIENMIDALPHIVAQHPDLVYIVLGATHPGIMAHSGEDYRLGLQRRARELGVQGHIEFVNKFVEIDELIEFLSAADVYVTPYLNEAQITSGTLAYALGTGKATVSTPYWYAQEMLADGRGTIVPFKDPVALASAVNHLFDNDTDRHAMRKRAYQFARQMRWSDVARQYLDLFAAVIHERHEQPRPAHQARPLRSVQADLAEIKLDHLLTLTDDVGIFHRAKSTVPDRAEGYRTDENAAALVAVLRAQDHLNYSGSANLDALTGRYLGFLDHAFDARIGRMRTHLSFDRRWRRELPSDLTHGRSVWALGEAVARCQIRGHMTLAANLFQGALPACEQLHLPESWAYSLIGIHAYLRRFSGDSQARRMRENLAHRLFERFQPNVDADWPWLSEVVEPGAALLPHALLLSGRWMFNDEMIRTALRSLEWLFQQQSAESGAYAPIGTEGGLRQAGERARFNQLPLDAWAMLDACLEASRVTAEREWAERAHRCLNWFLGANDLRVPLYDHTTGGCHDSLQPHGVSENQSAEASLAWQLSLLNLYEHAFDLAPPRATSAPGPSAPGPAAPAPGSAAPPPSDRLQRPSEKQA